MTRRNSSNIGPLGTGAGAGLFVGGAVATFVEPIGLALLIGFAAALAAGALGEVLERRAQRNSRLP